MPLAELRAFQIFWQCKIYYLSLKRIFNAEVFLHTWVRFSDSGKNIRICAKVSYIFHINGFLLQVHSFHFQKIFWLIWFVFYFYSILTNKKLDNRDSNYRREFDFRDKLDSAFGQSLLDRSKSKTQIIWYITHFYILF